MSDRKRARELATGYVSRGDITGWFESLYAEAGTDTSIIPWADLIPNPHLISWRAKHHMSATGKRALIVGCGFGHDAEELARWVFHVVAFDVSETAINCCKKRFSQSSVDYCIANVLDPPQTWLSGFNFVLECYTLQVIPPARRPEVIRSISSLVAPSGSLLVIARGREPFDSEGEMPWPLTRTELGLFELHGLRLNSWEDFVDAEVPPVRRFRAYYTR